MTVTNTLIPRVAEALKLLKELDVKADVYLDLGCNDGQITRVVAEMVKAKEVYGIDIDHNVLEKAKERGLKVFAVDFSKDRIPLRDESVISSQHLR